MYVHLITYEYFYKNTPQDVVEATMIAPCATSVDARLYFWYNIGILPDIEWSEVDSIRITYVRSTYIKV